MMRYRGFVEESVKIVESVGLGFTRGEGGEGGVGGRGWGLGSMGVVRSLGILICRI